MYKSKFKRKKKKPCHPFIDLGLKVKQHAINATNKTIPTKCLPHRLLFMHITKQFRMHVSVIFYKNITRVNRNVCVCV